MFPFSTGELLKTGMEAVAAGANVLQNTETIQSVKEFVKGPYDAVKGVIEDGKNFIGNLYSAVQAELPNVLSTATAALATPSYRGTLGNYATYLIPITLRAKFMRPVSENFADAGRLYCKTYRLGNLSGFCLCENPQVEFQCFSTEEEIIKAFLSGGFFIE